MIRAHVRVKDNLPRLIKTMEKMRGKIIGDIALALCQLIVTRFSTEAQAIMRGMAWTITVEMRSDLQPLHEMSSGGSIRPWKPLNQRTIDRRRRAVRSRRAGRVKTSDHILVDTGDLKRSIGAYVDQSGKTAYVKPFGVRNVKLAGIHEQGNRNRNLPSRPIFSDIAQSMFNKIEVYVLKSYAMLFDAFKVK